MRRIASLLTTFADFSCNLVDAKWLLFPFNKSCNFAINNSSFLNIYFTVGQSLFRKYD